jgi:hypothetical protein
MREVVPKVTRIIDVPAGVLLPELHDLLQVAVGWTDSHLHMFLAAMCATRGRDPTAPSRRGR